MKPEPLFKIINPLLDGLQVLHKSGLTHHDIKPENIIFVAGVPKLSDIGLVSGAARGSAGTPGYVPKWQLNDMSGNCADLYAVGKVIYCALTGLNADEFPIWPSAMFSPAYRPVNLFLLKACSENPQEQFQDVAAFRHALSGTLSATAPLPRKGGKVAVASFILGLTGLVVWVVPVLGLPVTLIGLIFGIQGLRGRRKILATVGLVLSIIGLTATIANSAIGAYLGATGQFAWMNQSAPEPENTSRQNSKLP
jgi:serine/threonine protein kinase